MRKKLGLIVNPIAGMGGAVGLKGTDGRDTLRKAVALGAHPVAPARAVLALKRISGFKSRFDFITYPGVLGEDEAREVGFLQPTVGRIDIQSSSSDTIHAVRDMLKRDVDLIIFAGGDGTARDVCDVLEDRVPVIGIPTGVKMHSGVFAISPDSAGRLALRFLESKMDTCREDVLDIDESAFRKGRLSVKLYGTLRIPCERNLMQSPKIGSAPSDRSSLEEIASFIIDNMQNDVVYVIGPGTTTNGIKRKLGRKQTLLGVDIVQNQRIVALDANEERIIEETRGRKAQVIVTPIGGQGFILGRGNQQLSPRLIRNVGRESIIVVATENKIASLKGRPLLVDTGDTELDEMLRGFTRVITGYNKIVMYKIA